MSAATSEGFQHAALEFSWTDSGFQFKVSISGRVVEALKTESVCGLESVPGHGAEVGGLLFGTIAEQSGLYDIVIDQSLVFPIEYRFGPVYRLSEADEARLVKTVRQFEGRLIGSYHSIVGLEESPLEDDRRIAAACFGKKNSLMMVCRPDQEGKVAANVFVWSRGRNEHRYDLDLGSVDAGKQQFRDPLPEAPAQPSREAMLPPTAVPPAEELSQSPVDFKPREAPFPVPRSVVPSTPNWLAYLPSRRWLMIGLICLGCIIAAGALVRSNLGGSAAARSKPPAAPLSSPAADPGHSGPLNLRVARQGDNLLVIWNGNSPECSQATLGTLTIVDGVRDRTIHLAPEELRTGSLVYLPVSGDVRFELSVIGTAGKVEQAVRVLGSDFAGVPQQIAPVFPSPQYARLPPPQVSLTPARKPDPKPAETTPEQGLAFVAAAPGAPKSNPLGLASAFQLSTGQPITTTPGRFSIAPQTASPPQAPQPDAAPASIAPASRPEAVANVALPASVPTGIPSPATPPPTVVMSTAAAPPPAPAAATAPVPEAPRVASLPVAAAAVVAPSQPGGRGGAGLPIPARVIRKVSPVLLAGNSSVRVEPGSQIEIEVTIDSTGRVSKAAISKSVRMFNPILQEAAVNAARKWQFEPAVLNGKPVQSQMILKFQFGPGAK